ncbi:carbohydrate-binding module family 1 protein [Piromyces sp. E2]|nr:carbohydrate-binding module family 1 protein [Piromyces sp. E2]|eukprot:OUM58338.1 carbohydrate-binding module family 1 protein [Piromyces sp. E2]
MNFSGIKLFLMVVFLSSIVLASEESTIKSTKTLPVKTITVGTVPTITVSNSTKTTTKTIPFEGKTIVSCFSKPQPKGIVNMGRVVNTNVVPKRVCNRYNGDKVFDCYYYKEMKSSDSYSECAYFVQDEHMASLTCKETRLNIATNVNYCGFNERNIYTCENRCTTILAYSTLCPYNATPYTGYACSPPKILTSQTTSTKVIPSVSITTTDTIPIITTTTTKVLPPKTTTTTTSNATTTTTKTLPCKAITTTVTEYEKVTVTEKETITVTINAGPTTVDDEKCAGKWEQCGGIGYNGPTCCQSGYTCHQYSSYYSQCI